MEIFFAYIVALFTWWDWYRDLFCVHPLAAPPSYRLVLGITPAACLLLLLLCLERLAARAVRENGFYILSYMLVGAASLGVSSQLFPFLGISARDDVLERRNNASLIAVTGALLGAMFCFAGGNIGEGPGVPVVILSAGTAMCAWFALWYFLEVLSGGRVSERITVERDTGSGIRLAGLLTANGVILGAAVAGDWLPDRFLSDVAASGWPALALTTVAAVAERIWGSRSSVGQSILGVSSYLLVALLWVLLS